MKQIVLLIALTAIFNLSNVNARHTSFSSSQEKITLKKSWSGKDLSNDLLTAAPPRFYIADAVSWSKLWQARRGSEPVPQVDFDRELIVFCTTSSPNSCGINLSLDEQGDLKITSVSTLIASDAKTFTYQIGLIDRARIRSIEGNPIAAGNTAANKNPSGAVVEQLKRMTQELLDAIAPGKKEVWDKYLTDGAIYTDEEGRVLTKEELLKELTPLPAGYVGTIKMGEPKASVQETVVILSHRDREELELYGQKIVTFFHFTGTWAKQKDGQWKLAAMMVNAIPNERQPAKISDPKILNDYAGQYQIAPEVFYTITREGDQLFGQRTGRAKEELLPLCSDIFYKKGVWRGEKVFERDAAGKIINLRDRRENNDLVWKKVK